MNYLFFVACRYSATNNSVLCLLQRLFSSAIFRYQYNMGARIDDSSKKMKANLTACEDEEKKPMALMSRLVWAKNINEERQAPNQILLGSDDPNYCVLLGLASWLEFSADSGSGSPYLFALDSNDDAVDIRRQALDIMKEVLEDPTFDFVIEPNDSGK